MPSSNKGNGNGKGNVDNTPVTGSDQNDELEAQEGSNKINGGDGDDIILGGEGYDFINAGDGDDVVTGGAGDDLMHGNDGFDTAVFSGSVFDYTFADGKGNATIVTGADGIDTLKHFELLKFDDYSYYIDGTNNAPFTRADSGETDEDTAVVVEDLLANDMDIDGDEFSITSVTASASGAIVTLTDPAGSVAYDPNDSFESLAVGQTASDSFDYTVTDSEGGSRTQSVTITVTGVNDAPTLEDGSAAASEDGAAVNVDLSVLGDDVDSDNDGGNLDYSLLNSAPAGSASVSGTNLSFDPGSAFQNLAKGETTSFDLNVRATDAHGATADNTVAVTVSGVNDAPTLAGSSIAAQEDGASVVVDLSVLGDDIDSDNDGGNLDYSLLNSAAGGTASITGSELTFNPGSDFQSLAAGQTQSFDLEIQAEDAHDATATNTVAVTVTGVNDAPVIAGGDSTGAVSLVPGQTPFLVEQWTGYSGSFSLASLQSAAAASAPDYSTTTNIIDFTDDPGGFSGEIPGSSPWPAAIATGASGTGGINNSFFARITANIVITEQDNYTFRTFNDDGVYLFVDGQLIINDPNQHPEAAFEGDITLAPGVYPLELFFFENGGEASLELTFKNTGGAYQHVATEPVDSGTLQFSDVDLTDSHTVTASALGAAQGTLTAVLANDTTGSGTGGLVNWDYQISNNAYQSLAAGATVVESFIVEVNDGKGGVAQQQVDITITGGNDLPVANDDAASTGEDAAIVIPVLVNDSDIDVGDVLTVTAGTLSDQGAALIVNGDGTISYDPSAAANLQALNDGESIVDTFTYTVSDGNGGSDTATVSVTVNGANDGNPPVDIDDVSTDFENGFEGWQIIGSTSVVPSNTGVGNMARLNGTGASEEQIEEFLGAEIPDGYQGQTGSAIMTTLALEAGDVLSFDYFFQANDYLPYNDFAVYMGTDGDMELLSNVAAVGNYGNSGWQTVTVPITVTGVYDIGFASMNAIDTVLWPQLFVDNLTVV